MLLYCARVSLRDSPLPVRPPVPVPPRSPVLRLPVRERRAGPVPRLRRRRPPPGVAVLLPGRLDPLRRRETLQPLLRRLRAAAAPAPAPAPAAAAAAAAAEAARLWHSRRFDGQINKTIT